MKFSCEKALLQSAIATASRATAPKSSIPALEGILLEYDGTQLEIQLDEETSVTLEKKELAWVSAIDEVEL